MRSSTTGSEGGPSEIITPGRDGKQVPFEDARALADAVLAYLSDAPAAVAIGAAARMRATEFSTDRMARRLLDALARGSPSTGG